MNSRPFSPGTTIQPAIRREPPKRQLAAWILAVSLVPSFVLGGVILGTQQALEQQINQLSKEQYSDGSPSTIALLHNHRLILLVTVGLVATVAGISGKLLADQSHSAARDQSHSAARSQSTQIQPPAEPSLSPNLAEALLDIVQNCDRTLEDLSTATFEQTALVDTIYKHITSETAIPDLQQSIAQGQTIQQLTQTSHHTLNQFETQHADLWVAIIETATHIQTLAPSITELEQNIAILTQLSTDIKLQAMNTALEASRYGDMGHPLAAISEQTHTLAQQLNTQLTTLPPLITTLSTTATTLSTQTTIGQQQASSSKRFVAVIQQQLKQLRDATHQMTFLNTNVIDHIAQHPDPPESIQTTVIEMANLTSQISAQSAVLTKCHAQLTQLIHNH